MYDGARDVVGGYTKSLWVAFGSPGGGVAVATMLLALFVLPWLLLAWTPLALVGAGAGLGTRLVAAIRCGDRILDVVTHPLSVLAFAALVGVSVARHRNGTVTWKGRELR